jgi:hypothetical protein
MIIDVYLSWDFFALTLNDIIPINDKLTSPIYRNKTLQAYSPQIEYTIFKPVLQTTQLEAESEQECNEQSLSVYPAPIFPTLQQNSVAAAAILLKEHHPITLKHEIQSFNNLIHQYITKNQKKK